MQGSTYERRGKWYYQIDEKLEDGKRQRTVRLAEGQNKAEAEIELQNKISTLKSEKTEKDVRDASKKG